MTKIRVSESFYSIQGEGPTVGVPAVFVRLQGCNLNCGSQSGDWVCDTVDVWKKGTSYDIADYANELITNYNQAFSAGAHLIITGGEPLLQQDAMVELINKLPKKPVIEVETNGTIKPSNALIELVDQWNVSPKLANSGESKQKRINNESLQWFSTADNAIFKFVVSKADDITEINQTFHWVSNIATRQKFIMPAADSKRQLHDTYLQTIDWAKQSGFSLSQRFHLSMWDQKTGI